jgi:hypothetical protein
MNWTDIDNLDLDQAAQAVWERNQTRTRLETIRRMLAGEGVVADEAGYKPDGDFKHQMVNLGPYAERVVARLLTKGDNIAVRAPDNNNSRDIYIISNGQVQPHGAQVKLGDPNEHIFYSLRKRLASGNRDTIILDDSLLEDGKLGSNFTPYKRSVLQSDLDRTGVRVVGVPGLVSRARTERQIQGGGLSGLLARAKRIAQDAIHHKEIVI